MQASERGTQADVAGQAGDGVVLRTHLDLEVRGGKRRVQVKMRGKMKRVAHQLDTTSTRIDGVPLRGSCD